MRHQAALALLALLLTSACNKPNELEPSSTTILGTEFTPDQVSEILSLSPLPQVPSKFQNKFADHEGAALFGQHLFFETRFSKNNQISCATCHDPKIDFTDGQAVSTGLEAVTRNSPTLINLAHNRWFYWDGRKDSLWSQSLEPIENSKEMGGSRIQSYHLIAKDQGLRKLYEDVFGPLPSLDSKTPPAQGHPNKQNPNDPDHLAWTSLNEADQLTVNTVFANLGKSIAAYERRLVSKNSPFDRFVTELRNNDTPQESAISASAVRGLKLFIDRGQCTFCHSGPNFTDLEFHNIGLDRGGNGLDTGRYDAVKKIKRDPFNGLGSFSDERAIEANKPLFFLAQKPNNLGEFKTPTLRNIANTSPYMHDGRFANLRDLIRFYSELDQTPALGHREETLQPLGLSEDEINDLISFLETLTGESLPTSLLKNPAKN